MTTSPGASRAMVGRSRLWFPTSVILLLGACTEGKLLEVETPDIITTDQVSSADGAQAQRVAAVGLVAQFLNGGQFAFGVALTMTSAILSDEAFVARNGSEHVDRRSQINASFPANSPWTPFGDAHNGIVRAIRGLNAFPPSSAATKSTQLGQLYMLHGFVYVWAAETYCNGIPVSNVDDVSPSSTVLSTEQLYGRALAQFDTALATLSTSATDQPFRFAARVGKGRAYIDINQFDNAAAVVGDGGDGAGSIAVPNSFVYNAEHYSVTQSAAANGVYRWMVGTRNFGASDKEGINGLDYVSANDPRIRVDGTQLSAGQDGTLVPLFTQYPQPNSPVPMATGIEARMIEAENFLRIGDVASFIGKLNDARTTVPGLAPLADPGTTTARVDMLFRERAFWMYFTAHRLGDMRRLIRQYGRNAESVYPTGPYFKGGVYGTDLVLVPDQSETNNPVWSAETGRTDACTDKSA